MKRLILAIFALAALSSSAFAYSPGDPLPSDVSGKWDLLKNKKGTVAYNSFIATRNYVEACYANGDNPPKMPKNFKSDYVSDSETQTVSDAVVQYYVLHPSMMA